MTSQPTHRCALQSGLTLVELMIAMTLGLFLLLGLTGMFLSQRQAYRTNENLAQLQNHARVAFELLAREIRESGVNLCGAYVVGNVVVNANASSWHDWSAGGIQGYEGNVSMPVVTTGTGAAERVAGTDGVILRSASLLGGATIAAHPVSSDPIAVNTTAHGFKVGDILMACDYMQAAIFQATSASDASTAIGHAAGTGTPGNCDSAFPLDCASAGTPHTFATNGFLTPLSVTAWYIGDNGRGGRSLYRILNNGTPQEIAAGVSDMQIQYLTRTGTSPATSYVDASAISSWATGAAATVIAARVILDLESAETVGTEGAPLARQLIFVASRRGYREIP